MKKIFQKTGFFLLLSMLISGAAWAQTDQLYLFNTNGTKQTFQLSDIIELTFTEGELVINKTSGDPVSVAFNVLDYFSTKDKVTSINNASATNRTVTLFSLDDAVVVKSPQTITSVSVLNLQGQKLVQLYPLSQEVNVSLATYPSGVYLIQVADKNEITTNKIIKK